MKPRTQRAFVEFSVALFDALRARDLARFDAGQRRGREAIEVFRTASWRALGIRPLPGKANATAADLDSRMTVLSDRFGVTFDPAPTHDELRAAVAGLTGIALAGHRAFAFRAHGVAPFQACGVWCEGTIGVAVPANSSR